MKRILAVIIVFCLGMALPTVTKAESTDLNAPQLISVSVISDDVVGPGDSINIKIVATDDLSGLADVGLHFELEGTDGKGSNSYDMSKRVSANECEIEINIGKNMLSGNWRLKHVLLWDNANNLGEYSYEQGELADIVFTVENPDGDFAAPVLHSISVTPNTGSSDSAKFHFEADITDDKSEVTAVEISYFNGSLEGDEIGFSLQKNSDTGKFEGDFWGFYIANPSRNLLFGYIRVADAAGNAAFYSTRADELANLGGQYNQIEASLDLTLTDIVEDHDLPELIDFEWKESEVVTPNEAELIVKAQDATSGIRGIEVWLMDLNGTLDSSMTYFENNISNTKKEFVVKRVFSKYAPSKTYKIYSIKLIDAQGNSKTYSVDGEEPIEDKSISVVNKNKPDLLTSTKDVDYISKIAALPEGSIVVVDTAGESVIKKELFDTIKGKNITVVFERAFGNEWDMQGIQWVMNGREIINETKDIDVNVYVEKASNTSWKDNFEKLHGKPIPTLEMGGITEEEADALFIKMLTEQGWEDVVKAVEAERADGESFSNRFSDLYLGFPYLRIVFAENGVLPGKSNIRLNVDYATRNIIGIEDLSLYYYNEDNGKYELVQQNIGTEKDGFYEFDITHNSTYALSAAAFEPGENGSGTDNNRNDEQNGKPTTSGSVQTGDKNSRMVWGSLMMFGIIVAIMLRKQTSKKM